jgi:hypothetical protein
VCCLDFGETGMTLATPASPILMQWHSVPSLSGAAMSAQRHLKFAALLLTGSITMEITLLAGLFPVNDLIYHGLHLVLMAALITSQWLVFRRASLQDPRRRLALCFAFGALFTAVGDYVNGALSAVQPVSLKLTWAMLLFGIGYTLYTAALWKHSRDGVKPLVAGKLRPAYWMALPVLAVNVLSWFQHVEPLMRGMELLYYGSFVFNATIYVLMPTYALWFFLNARQSTGSLLVLCGALLISYSDLILFATWLKGDPAVPEFPLYAFNWILYFGGQVLISLFPALALQDRSAPD